MCISIVFGINSANGECENIRARVEELGRVYEYGIGMGEANLFPAARAGIISIMSRPEVVFELHDLPELHCACDIDHDIRIAGKLGKKSKFFDFVREALEHRGVGSLSVLFFQDELPAGGNIRKHLGTYDEFVNMLNRWNTWQVEGFEPTRGEYFIADASPLLYTFTDKKFPQ